MRSILASHSICLCGKRVRTTASFRQSVSRNFLGRAEQRQIFAFVFFLAKVNDRQRADTAMPAIRDRERSHACEPLGDNHRGDLVEILPAVLLGYFDTKQAEFSAAAQKRDRDVPFLVLDPFLLRQDFLFDKLFGHVPDHHVLFGKIFRREHIFRDTILDQKTSAFF